MIPHLGACSLTNTLLTLWIFSSISRTIARPSAQVNPPAGGNGGANDALSPVSSNKPPEEAIYLINEVIFTKTLDRPYDIVAMKPPMDVNLAHIVQAPPGYGSFFFTPEKISDNTEFGAKFTSQTFYSPRTPHVTAASDATNIIFPAAPYMTYFMIPNIDVAKETIGLWINYPSIDPSIIPPGELMDPRLTKYQFISTVLEPDERYGQAAIFLFEGMRVERVAVVHDLGTNTMCTMKFEHDGRLTEIDFNSESGLIGPFEKVESIICYQGNA